MVGTIRPNLPKKPEIGPVQLYQALINKDLKQKVEAQRLKDNLTQGELITACFLAYLSESKKQ